MVGFWTRREHTVQRGERGREEEAPSRMRRSQRTAALRRKAIRDKLPQINTYESIDHWLLRLPSPLCRQNRRCHVDSLAAVAATTTVSYHHLSYAPVKVEGWRLPQYQDAGDGWKDIMPYLTGRRGRSLTTRDQQGVINGRGPKARGRTEIPSPPGNSSSRSGSSREATIGATPAVIVRGRPLPQQLPQ